MGSFNHPLGPDCLDSFVRISGNADGVGGDVPRGDGVAGGTGGETSRIAFCLACRCMGGQREPAHFGHRQLALTASPRGDRRNRLAGPIIVRMFSLKQSQDAPGFSGRFQRPRPVLC